MFSIHGLFGLILLLYTLVVMLRGRVTVSDGDRYNRGVSRDWLTRSGKPVQFWLFVVVMLAVAGALFLNVFHLPF